MTTLILYALLQFGLSDYNHEAIETNDVNTQYSSTQTSDSKGGWDDLN